MHKKSADEDSHLHALRFSTIIDDESTSSFTKYRNVVVGRSGILEFIKYEILTTVFGSLPGALGIILRKFSYPLMFGRLGRGSIIGSHVTIRKPKKIIIGSKTVIDDFSVISVRGFEHGEIVIENNVLIGRGSHIRVKDGKIRIGNYSRIGPYSFLGTTQKIDIGKHVTTGPLCNIGLLSKNDEDPNIPNAFRASLSRGGVTIEDNVAIGGNVVVLDGVRIGDNSAIGAGSVITKDIPDNSIAYGVPAKVTGQRFKK